MRKHLLSYVLILLCVSASSQTVFNFETGSAVSSPAGGWTNPGVGTYYRSSSASALTLSDLGTACNGYTKYNGGGSNVIFFQPAVDITGISVSGTGTGSNRTYSAIATSSTIGGSYTDISGASGSGGIGTGGSANCGTISVTNTGTITANTFIRITFSGNINTTRIDIVPATVVTPSTQATNIVFSNVAQTSFTVGLTRGNGSNVAVFVKDGSGAITNPVDGTSYTANTVFGSGTQLGSSGYYCVYAGNGASVNITGLTASHTYYVQAFEYNGTLSNTKYLTTTATNNPNNQTTLALGADFRTAASGVWSSASTWETYNGSAWVAASAAPSNTDGSITIRSGHTITLNTNISADELSVASGGELDINAGSTLTISDGSGTDATIAGTIKNLGTFTLSGTATMNVAATGVYEDAQAATTGTITIPTATWSNGSTFKLSGLIGAAGTTPTDYNNLQGVNQTFSNFIVDVPNLIGKLVLTRNGASLFAVTGTLTVNSTGTSSYGMQIASSGNQESVSAGSYIQNGGIVSIIHNSGNATAKALNVTGAFTLTGTSVFNISAYTTGSGTTTLNVGGNVSVGAAATLQRNTSFGFGGTSKIIFNGTASQTVAFGLATNDTVQYTINNAAGVILGSDLTARSSLTFTTGKVTTGSFKVFIDSVGSVTGGGTGWVIGNLQKRIATGATSKTFEIGDAGNYRPVLVSFGSVTTAGNLLATVSQSTGDHPQISSSGIDGSKSVNRYWTLTNTGIVFDNYAATFNFVATDVDAGASTASFQIKKYNGSAWSNVTPGTRTATSMQGTGLTSFSDFAIGELIVLPVTIVNFRGEQSGTTNKLFWSTSTETNNKGFELERSADGMSYSLITFVASKADRGNSTTAISYGYDDSKALAGANYYRLKQIDNDGKYNYSNVVVLTRKVTSVELTGVYPNPATRELNVKIVSPQADKLTLVITDLTGKAIIQQPMSVIAGDNQKQLNISTLAAGTYVVKAICANGCETVVQRFIKN